MSRHFICLSLHLVIAIPVALQAANSPVLFASNDIFQTRCFIENKGQFNAFGSKSNPVYFGVNNLGDRFYFRSDGYLCDVAAREMEKEETDGNRLEEEGEHKKIERAPFEMLWVGSNANVQIETEQKTKHYFTYGDPDLSSYGYKKITYRNLYPDIDVIYEVPERGGIKYSIIVHPGGDLSQVRFKFKGVSSEQTGEQLLLDNDVLDYVETIPLTYEQGGDTVPCSYVKDNNGWGFNIEHYNQGKTLVVDPWVRAITTLTSTNVNTNNCGHDVDFDYAGNLYVYGGGGEYGEAANCKVAKYDINGNLLWTFSGVIISPSWTSSNDAGSPGNFVVEKVSGKVYVGQSFDFSIGTRVIRLTTTGVYDNFINVPNPGFNELWDMAINCQTNALIAMGGTTQSNLNFGLININTGNTTYTNFSGSSSFQQDIANYTFGNNGELYTIIASLGNPAIDNHIFYVNPNLAAFYWNQPTGFTVLREAQNRHYISTFSETTNNINCLDANGNYLFYYDGINLKAFSLTTGAGVGNPTSIAGYTPKFQCGIYADECNNVYAGGTNGNLKVYHFNGTNFTAQPDLVIGGAAAGKHIYDLRYHPGNNLIYISGEEFVAVVLPAIACSDTAVLNAQVTTNCDGDAFAEVINPTMGNSYSYIWADSSTGVILSQTNNSNSPTDTIGGLQFGTTYSLTVIKNATCGGASNVVFFRVSGNGSQYTDNVQLCIGQMYNGQSYFADTSFIDTLINTQGCDSIMHTFIDVMSVITSSFTQAVCFGESFSGQVWLNNGALTDTFSTGGGCDSIHTTLVQVLPIAVSSQVVPLCANQTYNGQYYNSDTVFVDTITSVNGCDSIRSVSIQVLPVVATAQTVVVCINQTYLGQSYSNDTVLLDSLTSFSGCDSIHTTVIDVVPVTAASQLVELCANQTYQGKYYSNDTVLAETLTGINGCDSVLTTQIHVLHADSTHQTFGICYGERFMNVAYTNDTSMQFVYQNAAGCDSIESVALTVFPLPNANAGPDARINYGSSIMLTASGGIRYLWDSGDTTASINVSPWVTTLYFVEVTDPNGCNKTDSVIVTVFGSQLFVPNAFSPNGDGQNDVWQWQGSLEAMRTFEVQVFNRWGEKVFETSNFRGGWDGTYRDELLSPGVFVYVIKVSWSDGHFDSDYKGSLTLLR